ncbi:hypothetical protein OEZ85_011990 [Tetradesmus obliquus]|uniref:Trafficking protein particle complex subunit 11 C-terminal domain-containing protein n=1 Tax=Tetradesmus obliquus TaxID=3088 RepID=A0ABY8TRZ9_TETOB|nr:hypothetical protein OEZ85_011990 [Tetradesmus obliquus]
MKAAGSSSSPSSSPRLLDGQPPGQQQQQQQLGGSSSPVAAAGSPSSPLGSSSSSSTAWNYVVQQLDLPAALQQVPAKEQAAQASAVTDLLLRFNQQDFGWWRILTVAGGFTAHAPDPAQLQLCVALYCHLPVALPLIGASLTLTDSQGSWTVSLAVGPGPDLQQQQQQQQHAAASGQQGVQAAAAEAADALQILQLTGTQDAAAAGSWPLMLQPGSWQLLHVRFPPRCVGAVAAEQLQLQLSEHCTVSFVLGSFPPGRPALGSSSLPGGEPFKVRQGVRLGAWLGKVQHVGRLPQLQVLRPELLLVNELAPLQVTVSASSPQLPATLQLSLRTAMGATPAANSDAGALATAAAAQSQGSEDASAAAGAAEGVPLEVGQVVFAQVLVRALHAVELQLLDAQLELQQEAGLQLLNKLSDQLAGRPLAAAQGSVHCLLLQLVPMANTSSPVSMGRLTLRWKRQQPAAVAQSSSSTSTSSSVSAGPAAAAAAELAVGAAPPDEVTTSLELPRVLVQDSLLSAKVVSPHRATAGIAFPFTVQLRNLTSKPQELLVSVQEAPSFVFSGSKQQAVTLMPKDSSSLSWTLVAHVSGQLPLPAVRVSSVRFSSQVVTQSAHVHVMPF